MKIFAASMLAALALYPGCARDAPTITEAADRGIAPSTRAAAAAPERQASAILAAPDLEVGKGTPVDRAVAPTAPLKALALPVPPKKTPKPAPVPPTPEPAAEPEPPPAIVTPPAPAPAPPAPAPAARPQPRPAPPLAPRRQQDELDFFPSTPVAVAATIGAAGLVMGAFAVGGTDNPPSVPFAAVSLGIAAAGFTTAAIFVLIDTDGGAKPLDRTDAPDVQVGVGPASVGMVGAF